MGLYISRNLVLNFADQASPGRKDRPIIGWHNLVTSGSVEASYSAAGYPASNIGNPSTASYWRSDRQDDQELLLNVASGEDVDYVGLARHNFGSINATIIVEGLVSRPSVFASGAWDDGGFWRLDDEPETPVVWAELVEGRIPPDDAPAILRFEPTPVQGVRIRIEGAEAPPSLAVAYVGKLLVMQKAMEQGYVPVHLAAQDDIVTGLAESGDYLGRVVTRRALQTGISFQYLGRDWFDANMIPFMRVARQRPFFFAWMPDTYPDQAAFCWTTSDLRPEAESLYMHLDFQIGALVR